MKRAVKGSIKTSALISAVVFFGAINIVQANTNKAFEDVFIVRSVNQHPDVVEKFNAIEQKSIEIGQIIADDSLKLNLSNRSRMPWKTNVKEDEVNSDDPNRFNDIDKKTHDLLLTADKTLIDFGLIDNRISAEKNNQMSIELEYLNTFEATLQKLINTSIQLTRSKKSLRRVEKTLNKAKQSITAIKKRFELGAGTLSQVRQAQLLLLELESNHSIIARDYKNSRQILNQDFQIDVNQAQIIAHKMLKITQKLQGSQLDVELVNYLYTPKYQRSSEMINYQKTGLRAEIKSIKSGNFPRLGVSLTAVGYDWDHKIEDYELYGSLNLSMPLYDGGTSNNKIRGLEFEIKMLLDREVSLERYKNTTLTDLIDRLSKLKINHKLAQLRSDNIREKLAQIQQRMTASEEGLMDNLQTTLSLDKEELSISEYPFYLATMSIDFLALSEILMQQTDLQPK